MKFSIFLLPLILTCIAGSSFAQTPPIAALSTQSVPEQRPADHWRLLFSPYSFHYSRDPDHRPVWMIGAERQRADTYVLGAVYFSNSFGQDSVYLYGGQRLKNFSAYDQLFAQWTAGLMYGYKGKFADKVPFNHGGFSPGAVLTIGWQFSPRYAAQVNVLGNSALMFQVAADLP